MFRKKISRVSFAREKAQSDFRSAAAHSVCPHSPFSDKKVYGIHDLPHGRGCGMCRFATRAGLRHGRVRGTNDLLHARVAARASLRHGRVCGMCGFAARASSRRASLRHVRIAARTSLQHARVAAHAGCGTRELQHGRFDARADLLHARVCGTGVTAQAKENPSARYGGRARFDSLFFMNLRYSRGL